MKTMVTLLSIVVCFLANAQTAGVYKGEGAAACTILTLLPDHSFCYKETCEPSPRLSFGEWSVKKDVVQLQPVAPQSFTVIKRIESSKLAGDSIWLTIFDKEGANMSAILSVGLEMSGRGSYLFSNDASGAKNLCTNEAAERLFLER